MLFGILANSQRSITTHDEGNSKGGKNGRAPGPLIRIEVPVYEVARFKMAECTSSPRARQGRAIPLLYSITVYKTILHHIDGGWAKIYPVKQHGLVMEQVTELLWRYALDCSASVSRHYSVLALQYLSSSS